MGGDESTLLAELRADYEALSEKRTIKLVLPGFPRLVGCFKAVGRETLTDLRNRAEKVSRNGDDARAGMGFDADLLINTCEGIFERREDDLVPLNTLMEKWGDEPIVFDRRLAEAVGADITAYTAEGVGEGRAVVYAVFRVDEPDTGNDLRFAQLATRLWRWIRDGQAEVDEDF